MTETVHHDYGERACTVRERGTLYLDGVPDSIETDLERAGFVAENGAWEKRRGRLTRDGDGLVVATVHVEDDHLRVEPRDVVGVVSLVPGTSLEIEPKVGWEPLVEMLLTVYGLDRSDSYFDVPLSAILSGDPDTSQIVALLAINYVRGVRTVRREGLVRDIEFTRRTGFEGRGSVDMTATLRNRAAGNPRPVWIDTTVAYETPVNATLHRAGRVLQGLLQHNPGGVTHPKLATLQSLVEREVRHLERRGVESSASEIHTYSRLSVADLPRQRRYYEDALRVSRSVLAGSLLDGGGGSLLVDYAFGTERLFQEYTQRVIELELDALRAVDTLGILDSTECRSEPTLRPFTGDSSFIHEPDHLLVDDDEPLAVLDSKYYGTGKNPLDDGDARSRLFAYTHLTGVTNTALLTPGYHEETYEFRDAPGVVDVLSPEPDDFFTHEAYTEQVRAYLRRVLREQYPPLKTVFAAADHPIVLLNQDHDLSRIEDTGGPFATTNPLFVKQIFDGLKFHDDAPNRNQLQDGGDGVVRRIETVLAQTDDHGERLYPKHRTNCVPIYRRDADVSDGESLGPNGDFGLIELHLFTAPDPAADSDEGDDGWSLDIERIQVY